MYVYMNPEVTEEHLLVGIPKCTLTKTKEYCYT
jgi:hypothetical protein